MYEKEQVQVMVPKMAYWSLVLAVVMEEILNLFALSLLQSCYKDMRCHSRRVHEGPRNCEKQENKIIPGIDGDIVGGCAE